MHKVGLASIISTMKWYGIDYGLGQKEDSENRKYRHLEASVVQKVDCPAVGIHDETVLRPKLKPKRTGESSSVIKNYNDDPANTSKLPNEEFKSVFEQQNASINSDLPSIKTQDFESDYKLRLLREDAAYEAPIALVDDLKQGWRPTHLRPPISIRRI
ncbi:unnamed protein product [Dibothriocephalus latus]|uniref:Uncharacterized protein n=1 Tax=Dibothriocephalus latus TaxID=60516 RepID=A0A3P7LR61_DIBLA|nr:unnamed protein product [Dibothriocephalus latus]